MTTKEKMSQLWEGVRSFPKRTAARFREIYDTIVKGTDGSLKDRILKALKKRKKRRAEHEDEGPLFVENDRPRPFTLSVLFTTLKIFIIAVVLMGFAGVGLVLGIAKAYVETTQELDIQQLTVSDRTSYIYDMNGELITTFAGIEYRDWVDIEDVPDMMKNALISVEDVRFYMHSGIDYKRLFSAIVNTFLNRNTHGGSTITQQLVKNQLLSNEQSYKRKIQEAYLALEVESAISKDEILEAYLNDVFLGESNYGIKTAARDYFGKELSSLTIRECAMLAGMVQKPYVTNPRANTYSRTLEGSYAAALEEAYSDGSITEEQYNYSLTNNCRMYVTDIRTNTVLISMYNAGFITRAQYDAALAERVAILQTSQQKQPYEMPHFVEYAIRDVVTHMLEARGLMDTSANRAAIESELKVGGYHIYTTVDPDIQNTVQETLSAWDEYPELADPAAAVDVTTAADGSTIEVIQPQASAVVLDYHTGELRAIVGSRDVPMMKKSWNRAYQSAFEVGSSIKPLAVYGPALDLGASPATIIANLPGAIDGWGGERGYPSIGAKRWIGPVSVRRGVVSSLNVVAARTLFEYVTVQRSVEYLTALGVDPERINSDGPGLALGTSGITMIEMAAAYGAVANTGTYLEPLSFTRVVDQNGEVVLDADAIREQHRVFKESTAYLLIDILENAVRSGTGTKAKISGMTVAGKTGTNSDYSSVFFSGITPYYTATVWIGHDYSKKYPLKKGAEGGSYAAPLWQAFMEPIHEGLADRPIIDASPGDLGLRKCTVCSVSGLLATDACYADEDHEPITDWFLQENMPEATCDMHVMVGICSSSGGQATYYCPSSKVTEKSMLLVASDSIYGGFERETVLEYLPTAIFTDIDAAHYGASNYEPSFLCSEHTPEWLRNGHGDAVNAAAATARLLIDSVNTYLSNVFTLPDSDRATLVNGVETLVTASGGADLNMILLYTEQLQYNYDVLRGMYPPAGG